MAGVDRSIRAAVRLSPDAVPKGEVVGPQRSRAHGTLALAVCNPSVAEIGVQLIARWNGEAAGFGGFTRWVQNCLPIFDGSLQETEVLAGRWRTAV